MSDLPAIGVLRLGQEQCPVVVIDKFAGSADRWRDEAAGDGFAFRGDFYPGKRKHVGSAYFDDIGRRLGSILRTVYGCTRSLKVDRALYSIVSTSPDQLSLAQRIPHIDDVSAQAFAMVHYLSDAPFGGTAFYRHRSTGLARIFADNHQDYLSALELDLAKHGTPQPAYVNDSTPVFERIGEAGFVYNRAVIYPCNLLQCSIVPQHIDHPDDPQKGRLTIAAFFVAS